MGGLCGSRMCDQRSSTGGAAEAASDERVEVGAEEVEKAREDETDDNEWELRCECDERRARYVRVAIEVGWDVCRAVKSAVAHLAELRVAAIALYKLCYCSNTFRRDSAAIDSGDVVTSRRCDWQCAGTATSEPDEGQRRRRTKDAL